MEIKSSAEYIKSKKCSDVYAESKTDYVLPDYLGDIRKVLYTEASLRPSGRFLGGEAIEFSGVVVYDVIYLDSEGALSSIEITSDYDYSVKCGDNCTDSVADTRLSNYAVRVMGPRRLSAGASLVGCVRICETSCLSVNGSAAMDELTPELDLGSVMVRQTKTSSAVEREYAESVVRLDGVIADEFSTVYSSVEPIIESAELCDGVASVKGRLCGRVVIKCGDEPAYGVERTIPFDESLELDGVGDGAFLIPRASVTSLKTSINTDDNGLEVVLSCIMELCALAEENRPLEVVLDGFLKEMPTDNQYSQLEYTKVLDCREEVVSHSAEIARADLDSEGLHEVIFLTSTPRIERVEREGGCATVFGEVRYSGIASELVGDRVSYTGIKLTSPFSQTIDFESDDQSDIEVEVGVCTDSTSATLDSEKLYVGCRLCVSATLCQDSSVTVLSNMECIEGEKYATDTATVTVYYPTTEDTLFSVSKRYHTSPKKLAADNDITESVFAIDNPRGLLSGVKRLVIY